MNNELLLLFKKRLMWKLLNYKLFNKKRIRIGDREVLFTDISKSNLLMEITIGGFRAFEGEVVKLIENYPWHIDKFIDAGANIGFYSILGSIFLKKPVEIIAVEPFPENVRYIEKLKRINNFDFRLIDKAMGGSDGKAVVMYYPVSKSSSRLSSSASLINSFKGTDGVYGNLPYKTITVQTSTLPTLIGSNTSSALVKLDCEGSELEILETSSAVLKRPNVDFIIEIMINDKDKNHIYKLMKSYGYDAYLITSAGFIKEDRPLTLPFQDRCDTYKDYKRTIWKNHFFTKRDPNAIKEASLTLYGYYI